MGNRKLNVGMCLGALLVAFAWIVISSSTKSHDPETWKRSPADLIAQVESGQAAGDYKSALGAARQLTVFHRGTPEAERASAMIPDLERDEQNRAAEAAEDWNRRVIAAKWTYSSAEDPMTSKVGKAASIDSENTVNFGFPYDGDQRGTLVIRDHPSYGLDVIFMVREGQILCPSYEDCTIRVRFDDQPAMRWAAGGPSDNSSNAIFLRDEAEFIRKLCSSKIVRLQVEFYDNGSPIFEFSVGGFDYQRYRAGA